MLSTLLAAASPLDARRLRSYLSLARIRYEVEDGLDEGLSLAESCWAVGADLDAVIDWPRVAILPGTSADDVAATVAEALDGPLAALGVWIAYRLAVRKDIPASPDEAPVPEKVADGPEKVKAALRAIPRRGRRVSVVARLREPFVAVATARTPAPEIAEVEPVEVPDESQPVGA